MLYANTDDGSSALWVLNGDGVVIDNISYAIGERAPILAQINEHFGTSFTGWSDNEIGMRYGDSLPDWDAYEKIFGDFGEKIASHFTSSPIVFIGRLENDIYHYYAIDEDTAYGVSDTEGRIVTTIEVKNNIPTLLLEHMNSAGHNVLTIQPEIISLEMSTIVQNWDEYTIV